MEAGRLAVIGALMRGLVHVLNNKLVPILGYTQILAMQAEPGTDQANKIAIIERSTMEIRQIVENLKTRVSHEHLVIEEHDPHEIVDSALYILDYLFREHHIRVEQVRGADPAPRVELDRGRFLQAILALLQRLPAAFAQQHDRRLLIQTEFGDREWVLRLCDNGKRISPEQLRGILSPYDAGDDLFNDDRLNFSIASAVLKDHRGTLRVLPNDDLGITVEMRIPNLHPRSQRIA
jgi:C4-dicarboxylate-specific signal transduction histidine kinase